MRRFHFQLQDDFNLALSKKPIWKINPFEKFSQDFSGGIFGHY